jgi:hypothetical protein
MVVLATRPLHPQYLLLRIPHRDLLQADPHFHFLTDQSSRHRVGVVLDPNRAHSAHPHPRPLQRLQTRRRQRTQARQLDGYLRRACRVPYAGQRTQPLLILRSAGKIPTPSQEQCLGDRLLQVPMRRLGVAVFVTSRRVGRFRRHAVMGHQRPIVDRELLRVAGVMHRQRHPVRAMPQGHSPQSPQGVLPTAT